MHCVRRRLARLVPAFAATMALADVAHAQIVLDRFDPSERGSRFFAADSLELDGRLRLATGVVTSYGQRLRTFDEGGTGDPSRSRLIEHSAWIHPGASLVIAPGARFAIDVPLVLQSGTTVTLDGALRPEPGSPRLGDVRASFDLRLAGRARADVDGATLAAGVSAYIPTGSGADYTGDDFTRVAVRLATAARVGPLLAAARAGYTYRRDDVPSFAGVEPGSEASGVLGLGFRTERIVVGPELYGTTSLNDPFGRRSTPLEALLGAHLSFGEVRLGAGIGTLLLGGLGAPRLRGVLSLEWTWVEGAAGDRDRDGVLDADDVCPDVAGLGSSAGGRGCPRPPADGDGDGVVDAEDACTDLPGLRTAQPMTNGCPDSDRDGVPDPIDACPELAGDRSVLPRYDGCPRDVDGDGIADPQDACPREPGVASEKEAANGCPPTDRDGDGVNDVGDACPEIAGVRSPIAELNGCAPVRLEPVMVVPLGFDPQSGRLLPPSDAAVGRLAAALVARPNLRVHIVVQQVAGTVADPKRTLRQAKAVFERLVEGGVSRDRFDPRRALPVAQKGQLDLRVAPDGLR